MVDIVWEFQVRPGSEQQFEFHYSPEGTWAVLFRMSAAYHGTSLLRETDGTRRYFTLDRWESHEDFLGFRDQFQQQYLSIDKQCDSLTEIERLVGVFEVV
jgi:heme-degrading monooxygenase HmoA